MKKTIFHLLLYSLVLLSHFSCNKEQLNIVDPGKYLVTQISIQPNGFIDTTYYNVYGPYYFKGENNFRNELNDSINNNLIRFALSNSLILFVKNQIHLSKRITLIETTEKSIHVYYSAVDGSSSNDSIIGSMQFTYIP